MLFLKNDPPHRNVTQYSRFFFSFWLGNLSFIIFIKENSLDPSVSMIFLSSVTQPLTAVICLS